nr:MAG TPA: hypothetical protein [Caudoviricetes sp.]
MNEGNKVTRMVSHPPQIRHRFEGCPWAADHPSDADPL